MLSLVEHEIRFTIFGPGSLDWDLSSDLLSRPYFSPHVDM